MSDAAAPENLRVAESRPENPEQALNYCPACSTRLEPRRCKLICAVCGYHMSCSDYY